jgi:hypothetical protein
MSVVSVPKLTPAYLLLVQVIHVLRLLVEGRR